MDRLALETRILDGLVAHHPGVPTDVLRREARARLGRKAMSLSERGLTHSRIAAALGCSQPHVSARILPQAREEKASGAPSPLTTYLRQHTDLPAEADETAPTRPTASANGEGLDALRLDLQRRRRAATDQDERVRLGHALLRLLDLEEDLRDAKARVREVEAKVAALTETLP